MRASLSLGLCCPALHKKIPRTVNLTLPYLHLAQIELGTVQFAQDLVRGLRVVIACGWQAKILQWPDNDDDVVSDPKCFEGHKEDILHAALHVDGHYLATGDYEGRINIYNVFTGEKRLALYHRSGSFRVRG